MLGVGHVCVCVVEILLGDEKRQGKGMGKERVVISAYEFWVGLLVYSVLFA